MKLSVGIINNNEEKNITRTILAIKEIADEIIIVDSYSTDNTVELAKLQGGKVYVEEWKGYGLQKNSVIDKCKGEWILLIDADEEVSLELKEKIKKIIESNDCNNKVYKINFTAVCFGKIIKHGGWSNHYRIRLFKNGSGKYNDKEVHEGFITNENVAKLKEKIFHYTYDSLDDYFQKFSRYTSEASNQLTKEGKTISIFETYLRSSFKFFKMYILQLGFLDGYEGYLLSRLSSMYVLIKYSKLREKIIMKHMKRDE